MNLALKLSRLHESLRGLGPVVGVDGTVQDVDVTYDPPPTVQQQAAVEAAIASFDWSDAADVAWLKNLNPERETLREQAEQALNRLDQIINAANPTVVNLQAITQISNAVKDNSLYLKHLIKRLRQID
jgi:hypothetical protein